jgi:hypothetical protein
MLRSLTAAVIVAGTALFGAPAAQAETYWSIGINLPPAGVVVANAPRYPVYEAAPVYYAPAPRYVQREIYYAPPRVVYEAPRHRHWHHHHHRHERWESRRGPERHEHRWDDRRWDDGRDYGPYRGR